MTFNFGNLKASGVWTTLSWIVTAIVTYAGGTGHLEKDILAGVTGLVTAAHVHGLHVSSGKGQAA